jgi:hypothetical protein
MMELGGALLGSFMVWSAVAFCKAGIVSKYYRAPPKASRSARPIAEGGFPPWAVFYFLLST